MEAFLLFLLVAGGLLLAGTMFVVWIISSIVRGIARMATGPASQNNGKLSGTVQICSNPQCQCQNPMAARFCRRCGKSLPTLLRVAPNRVA